MDYPHLITIQRNAAAGIDPTAGQQDPDTGLWTGDTTVTDDLTTIWEGRCDVQDKGEVITRDTAGQPVLEADATCFLAKERAVTLAKENDIVTITWEDKTKSKARVLRIRRLDGVLLLRRLYAQNVV